MVRSPEKAKPFVLVKYFTFTSLIVIFVGTIVLSAINAYWVRTMLQKKSEDYALLLVENLNHQVFLQFVIPVAIQYGQIELRKKEQFERMDKVVRGTLHSFNVETVNIHDMNNVVSYSFDQDMMGKETVGSSAYRNARAGKSTSLLKQRGNFWEILLGFPKETYLVTYAPLRAEQPLSVISGPILGVVEIVQNLTDEYKEIFRLQVLVIQSCTIVMTILFVVLRITVKRGEKIIQKRTEERLALKEELDKARHLSSIGEMVAGISHEIRNPLGIIRSSAELLKKKMEQLDASARIPDIIVEESRRLNDIVTDFLNYARPSSPNLAACQLTEVVNKTVDFVRPQAQRLSCDILVRTDETLPPISGDAAMLYQAFLNIILNAMQAMPGGGTITVSSQLVDDRVRVCFEDDGPGVSDELIAKIWDPFFTTKEEGTGLGLGIVKNIVSAHNGEVRLENRPVGGASVIVEFPTKGVS